MRIFYAVLIAIVLGTQTLMCLPDAYAQELKYSLSGVLYEQPSFYFIDHGNLMNPNNEIFKYPEWTNNFYGKVNFTLGTDSVKFITQTRTTLSQQKGESARFDFITDDAYLDVKFGENNFLYAGKRNVRDGVGYGANPTDFMGENKQLDYTKREEERRVERKGNYLVGGDVFMKDISFTALYAPRIDHRNLQEEKGRMLLKGSVFLESINTDMSLHLFYGEIPGAGLNVSSSIGDNLILYTESALRWGSNKKKITVLNSGSSSTPRIFEITDPSDGNKVYPNIVLGGSYTFGNGTNLVAEYIYNGDGYDSSEWKDFADYLKYNNQSYINNFFKDQSAGNLAQGNAIMKFREMRKNYVFLRASNSKLIENVDSQVAFLLNADDSSFLVNPSVDYKLSKNVVVGVSSTLFGGKHDSEFGMMGWNTEITFILKYFF